MEQVGHTCSGAERWVRNQPSGTRTQVGLWNMGRVTSHLILMVRLSRWALSREEPGIDQVQCTEPGIHGDI